MFKVGKITNRSENLDRVRMFFCTLFPSKLWLLDRLRPYCSVQHLFDKYRIGHGNLQKDLGFSRNILSPIHLFMKFVKWLKLESSFKLRTFFNFSVTSFISALLRLIIWFDPGIGIGIISLIIFVNDIIVHFLIIFWRSWKYNHTNEDISLLECFFGPIFYCMKYKK